MHELAFANPYSETYLYFDASKDPGVGVDTQGWLGPRGIPGGRQVPKLLARLG